MLGPPGVSGAPGENVGADGFGERLSGGAAERPRAVPGASAGAPPATQPGGRLRFNARIQRVWWCGGYFALVGSGFWCWITFLLCFGFWPFCSRALQKTKFLAAMSRVVKGKPKGQLLSVWRLVKLVRRLLKGAPPIFFGSPYFDTCPLWNK